MNGSGLLARWRSLAPYLFSLLRIVAALLFMQVGTSKLFAFPAAVMPGGGTAPFGSLPWIAGFLEVFGGGLLLVGLLTRPVAFLLSGEMAFAYFLGHAPQGFWPVLNQGSRAVLYCFLFLYLSAAGPGPVSIDALISRGGRRVDFAEPRSTSEWSQGSHPVDRPEARLENKNQRRENDAIHGAGQGRQELGSGRPARREAAHRDGELQ